MKLKSNEITRNSSSLSNTSAKHKVYVMCIKKTRPWWCDGWMVPNPTTNNLRMQCIYKLPSEYKAYAYCLYIFTLTVLFSFKIDWMTDSWITFLPILVLTSINIYATSDERPSFSVPFVVLNGRRFLNDDGLFSVHLEDGWGFTFLSLIGCILLIVCRNMIMNCNHHDGGENIDWWSWYISLVKSLRSLNFR